MSNNKKNHDQKQIPLNNSQKIEYYKPVCSFPEGKVSKTFEKALNAVENMDLEHKSTQI